MSEHILVDTSIPHVLQVCFNRPEKKNALNQPMYRKLNEILDQSSGDDEIRVLLIHGAAGNFTSGNDIQDFLTLPLDEQNPIIQFLHLVAQYPKPLVVAATGVAVGIGTTLLLHSDLAYASRETKFRMPFVELGLVPEGGSTLYLPQMVGHRRASELLLLSELFQGAQACEFGLINECLDADNQVLAKAQDQSKRLAKLPSIAVQRSKALLKAPLIKDLSQIINQEAKIFAEQLKTPEAQQAMMSFLQKKSQKKSR